MKGGVVPSSRARVNRYGSHLVINVVTEADEGTYTVENPNKPEDVRRMALVVRGTGASQISFSFHAIKRFLCVSSDVRPLRKCQRSLFVCLFTNVPASVCQAEAIPDGVQSVATSTFGCALPSRFPFPAVPSTLRSAHAGGPAYRDPPPHVQDVSVLQLLETSSQQRRTSDVQRWCRCSRERVGSVRP